MRKLLNTLQMSIPDVIKLVTIVVTVTGAYWHLSASQAIMEADQKELHISIERRLSVLSDRQKDTDKVLQELSLTITRASVVLERIDKKIGNP